MTIWIDPDFKCYTEEADGRTPVETDAFAGKCPDYIRGCRFVPEGREWVREDGKIFVGEMKAPWQDSASLERMQAQYVEEVNAEQRETMDKAAEMLTDEQAVIVKGLYREWRELIGKKVKAGYRFTHEGKLYKTIQPEYTFVAYYVPGEGTESLFTRIDEAHSGTIYDPIPYEGNMALVSGLYYTENGILYHCWRDTGIPVYSPLADLVGLYVQPVEDDKGNSGLLEED